MGAVREQVVIARPSDGVFDWITDLRHDPQWFRGVREVRIISEQKHGVGMEYEQATTLFGWRFTARVAVVEYDRPRRMVLVSTKSATPFRATYLFEPSGDGQSTRFTLDAEVYGGSAYRLLGPLFLPLLRRAVRKRLGLLKQVLELRLADGPQTHGPA